MDHYPAAEYPIALGICTLVKLEVVDPLPKGFVVKQRKAADHGVDIAEALGRHAGLLHQLQCVCKNHIGDKEPRPLVLVRAVLQRLPALQDIRAHLGRSDGCVGKPSLVGDGQHDMTSTAVHDEGPSAHEGLKRVQLPYAPPGAALCLLGHPFIHRLGARVIPVYEMEPEVPGEFEAGGHGEITAHGGPTCLVVMSQ